VTVVLEHKKENTKLMVDCHSLSFSLTAFPHGPQQPNNQLQTLHALPLPRLTGLPDCLSHPTADSTLHKTHAARSAPASATALRLLHDSTHEPRLHPDPTLYSAHKLSLPPLNLSIHSCISDPKHKRTTRFTQVMSFPLQLNHHPTRNAPRDPAHQNKRSSHHAPHTRLHSSSSPASDRCPKKQILTQK
jgi:hypothetical protein